MLRHDEAQVKKYSNLGFATMKDIPRRGEEKGYGKAILRFDAVKDGGLEWTTSIFESIIGPFSKAYK